MIDLNSLSETFQTIFETANTTTAAVDLSAGLDRRVQKVLKLDPSRIAVQSSWYPFVTVYLDSKEITEQTIAKNQTTGKRKADLEFKIVGVIWNSKISNKDNDDADDDCTSLMENIEEILRSNYTLGGVATWSHPTGVTYHNVSLEEETSVRAGMLSYKVTVFY